MMLKAFRDFFGAVLGFDRNWPGCDCACRACDGCQGKPKQDDWRSRTAYVTDGTDKTEPNWSEAQEWIGDKRGHCVFCGKTKRAKGMDGLCATTHTPKKPATKRKASPKKPSGKPAPRPRKKAR